MRYKVNHILLCVASCFQKFPCRSLEHCLLNQHFWRSLQGLNKFCWAFSVNLLFLPKEKNENISKLSLNHPKICIYTNDPYRSSFVILDNSLWRDTYLRHITRNFKQRGQSNGNKNGQTAIAKQQLCTRRFQSPALLISGSTARASRSWKFWARLVGKSNFARLWQETS